MIVSPNHDPVELALGWGVLISGAAALAAALARPARERQSRARRLSDATLGGGLLLLGIELVGSTLPDAVRLPLVVGSIAATAASLAIRRVARSAG